ncbi:ABC transporter ATP-binding protein [Cellulomonas fimi]|uniref:ABC transporter related protein n=1 Tax=Cellulomonas fimi (strain ATCC 484 / DSM 20113 / JCM 1341 / CCUG 24087 / LMG 16345 / NBRC 15513 / NCIMB 8980 / NCTC 7547 / NRS-133) TaxID=590998 RepID=F4H301_CELFA|nr:ABC transporter ATP-binding protein [Cellulomonas fimi]AEE47619.1 ABC transporter related protein [Cellulomonas fimi ATCC 484]NNH08612.1 ABC transporter ATP-binding protein [Cellulomonas fimi]VEH36658.1 Daunorubicin/doxorubicin resistance ATP-binding protein DrrA [Cellulomonas fimi]
MSDAIVARGLVKTFGPKRALDGFDLTVRTGEVHGFLGPNGAGKSTTVRVLLGLLRADAGEVRLLDGDPWRDAVALHRRLAYIPGDVSLWPNLTGGEAIDLLGRLRGGLDPRRRAALVERFELDPRIKGRAYSKGNRQKVALVAALAADVELLLMDEPTSGLDPLMEAVFQDVVREAAAQGRTVLLSSHILAEVEALADRVTIIRQGRAVQSGSLDELRSLTRTTVTAGVQDGDAAERSLAALDGVHHVRRDDGHVTADVDTVALPGVLAALPAFGVRSLTAHPPTLEDLFLREYSDELVTLGVREGDER